MKKLCKYTVIRYIPDDIREEFINVGLVFHCPSDNFLQTKLIEKYGRVTKFDDEVDTDFLEIVLEGIKEEFSNDEIVSEFTPEQIASPKLLEQETSVYDNNIQFSPVYTIISNNLNDDFEDLFKTYVYYEQKKSERITRTKVKELMERVFERQEIFSKMDKNIPLDSTVGDTVKLDYKYQVNDKNYYFKAFSLDNNKNSELRNNAKLIAFDLEHLDSDIKNNMEINIVLNKEAFNEKTIEKNRVVFDILENISHTISIDELDDFIEDKLKK